MNESTITVSDLNSLLHIAETAARAAGAYLLQKLGTAKVEHQKSRRDDLLDADLEAERLILTHLRQQTPQFGITSEESGHEGDQHCYWLVDPLDGSANFQHGSPLFAVSIALVRDQTPTIGVIYLPKQEELFAAIQGQGAYLNGQRIQVSAIASLQDAIVHIGDFTKGDDTEIIYKRLQELSRLATQARRIRMIGTASTDLAYIACGRADLLVNHAKEAWDIEAGKLLILEAGGKVTTKLAHNDAPLSIYSNGILHQTIADLLG